MKEQILDRKVLIIFAHGILCGAALSSNNPKYVKDNVSWLCERVGLDLKDLISECKKL